MTRLSRRRFLAAAAALAPLGRLASPPAFAEVTRRAPPYLSLEKFILPGNDEFPEELIAAEISNALSRSLASGKLPPVAGPVAKSPFPASYRKIAPDVEEAVYGADGDPLEAAWQRWLQSLGAVRRAQFDALPGDLVRFEIASENGGRFLHRVGHWKQRWEKGQLISWEPVEEHVASAERPYFRDVTRAVASQAPSVQDQLGRGIPYWRSRLDPASGIDVYGSNGVAVGDIDNDGVDEIYVCQPGGLPNRLYKFGPDGQLRDLTEAWGAGILDDSSSALFLDLRNTGRQDLVLLRSAGPVLLLNEGGSFRLRTDAFQFRNVPAGGFTGMAASDFDRDGKLDLYLCCYVYFLNEAQYTYASPYHDARNGPPNFLFRNRLTPDGGGFFQDCTAETGMSENNDRFSFAPAWCDFNGDGWPDLYVANDFGRKNLYVNREGRFHDEAAAAGVEDLGPGMSAAWFDYDGDGRPDLYVANMWTAPGQRVTREKAFTPAQGAERMDAYRRHTKGNSLYRNLGDGKFTDTTDVEHAAFGRWAWSSGAHDFDNDGHAEILIACGMLTNQSATDLGGFFWRQVVARAPVTASPSAAYENGWNALNQFIREVYSWNGREPNVMHARRDGRYFDFSGVSGLDFADDSRAFAVTDFDGDGRPDVILKSRLGPQFRVMQNDCGEDHRSIAFQLRGTRSNRDAIGARVTVDGQTKWSEAGSGFLSQHSKRLLFGLGNKTTVRVVEVVWPSGEKSRYADLAAGNTYVLTEGSSAFESKPFQARRPLSKGGVTPDNRLVTLDTWFLEPVPLPTPQKGVQLLVLSDGQPLPAWPGLNVRVLDFKKETGDLRSQFEIFRRYLFDWRTTLATPLAFLLNGDGHAVRMYATLPAVAQCQADFTQMANPAALPFAGKYIKPPRRDFFKFGAAFLWAGYAEQALPYLDEVLRRTPGNARVLVLTGQIHLQANRLDLAESAFRSAIAANPDSAEAWSGVADVLDSRDRHEEALRAYEKALALKPDLLYTLLNAAHAADQLGLQTKAEAWWRRALAVDPQSPEAANGLGLALAKLGRSDEARVLFERAIANRKDYAAAINNLGVLYLQLNRTADAIAAFQYGVRAAPDEDILYLNLGRTYTRQGEWAKARQVMQQLLDRKPDNATALRALQELGNR